MLIDLKTIRLVLRKIKLYGIYNLERMVAFVVRGLGFDLMLLAYHQNGILKYQNNDLSGESYVINSILKSYFPQGPAIVFDVGANIGNYAEEIKQIFPKSKIYAFEPNSNTFQVLDTKFSGTDVEVFCLGLSSCTSKTKVYTFANKNQSGRTSLYYEVFSDLHLAEEIVEVDCETISLDEFCDRHEIEKIDFLKIDTEGHELEVLSGAKEMLSKGRINVIQFEFNEMNIISRVFLKDFYDILIDYEIYRIDSNRLIPLFDYCSVNEIFLFQNFLAIKKSMANISNNA